MEKGRRYSVRAIRVVGDIAFVTLTKGYEAVIDAADVPLVSGRNWYAQIAAGTVYAARSEMIHGRQRCVLMHRVIIGAPSDHEVDHRDLNGLNNRRRNLRIASRQQNLANRGKLRNNTSGRKGVRQHGRGWIAEIEANGARYYLGRFTTIDQASAAYHGAAVVLFGQFARAA
ncbi:MAG: putative DNA-binding protein [Phenylobacterium sp.]|nr:putative DNA-binding protein [Phenylobacterium sp.]